MAPWHASTNEAETGGAVALGEHGGRRLERQRRELDRRRERRRAKRALARGGGRPLSRQQQCGDGIEPVREELQEPDRGAVGPVQIVDDEQLRPLRRQRGDEPVQTVEHAERRVGVAGRQRCVRQHDGRRQRGGAGERPAARLGGHAAQPRLEQLADDPPRVRRLQIGSASARHGDVARPRRITRQLEQARLPDPRRPLHDDHLPSPRDHLVERIDDRPRLGLTLVKAAQHARRESMSADPRA